MIKLSDFKNIQNKLSDSRFMKENLKTEYWKFSLLASIIPGLRNWTNKANYVSLLARKNTCIIKKELKIFKL